MLERARARIDGWLRDGGPVPRPAAERWRELLEGPRPELLAALERDDEEMRELRQNTPFAGAVGNQQRWDLVRAIR